MLKFLNFFLTKTGYAILPLRPTQEMLDEKIYSVAIGQSVYESRRDLRPTIWKTMAEAFIYGSSYYHRK